MGQLFERDICLPRLALHLTVMELAELCPSAVRSGATGLLRVADPLDPGAGGSFGAGGGPFGESGGDESDEPLFSRDFDDFVEVVSLSAEESFSVLAFDGFDVSSLVKTEGAALASVAHFRLTGLLFPILPCWIRFSSMGEASGALRGRRILALVGVRAT